MDLLAAMIEFSLALAPLRKTGCSHTTRRLPRGRRLARRITTTFIGSPLSVIERYLRPINVGVVPEPASNRPGFRIPRLS